jgi:hypothetical protein
MLRLPTRIPITLPSLRTAIGISAAKQGGGSVVPVGFTATKLNGQQVYWTAGVLNITSGRAVYDNGINLFVGA